MPLVKGRRGSDDFIEITDSLRFKESVQFLQMDPFVNVWYVDYDNGGASFDGKTPASAMKHLQTAIDSATAGDVIYVRPRLPDLAGGDPASILPASTANWSIVRAKYGLNIVGTGTGRGKAGTYQTNLKGSTTVQATPTFDVQAPFVSLENLTFRRGSNTLSGVRIYFADPGTTYSAFGGTIYNCNFWKIGSTATKGALQIDSAWHTSVLKSTFVSCYRGIDLSMTNSSPQGITIQGCDFPALTAEVSANIYASTGVVNILMKELTMNHVLPTGGAPNLYISFGGASTGLFCDSFIGAANTAVATNTALNGVLYSGVRVGLGLNLIAT